MGPVEKALWFVENKFERDLTLDAIADACGVSRFHLARAFLLATGYPVMGYVRARRLSEAARSLAAGAPDILAVALDAGYGSHEAFTRAFRDQFGLTPEQVRGQRHLDNLALTGPIGMDQSLIVQLEPPRFENGKTLLIAGFSARYVFPKTEGIPSLWQRLTPHIGHIAGQVGGVTYGVSYNFDDAGSFEYLAGVEVASFSGLPDEFSRVRIGTHRYAVFSHSGHISNIPATHNTIWNRWLPESGHQVAEALNFERYDQRFDPHTGTGTVEIWIPIK